jgi:hypothetical protein
MPVPFPLSVNVTPVGSVPDSVSAGAGKPIVVTTKEEATCSVNVVPLPEVIAGPSLTVSVKVWTAFAATPLLAVMVIV